MNIRNKTWNQTSMYSVLFATLVATAPAFAAGNDAATLASSERAARDAIVDSTFATAATRSDPDATTLARNERAAQRAVVDVAASDHAWLASASGDAKLLRNELAAQRAIADTQGTVAAPKKNRGQVALDSTSEAVSLTGR